MKFNAPLYVDLPRKRKAKRVMLNLNVYRNLHHITNNQAKVAFCEAMKAQLLGVVLDVPISLSYVIYKPSNRIQDTMNVGSVVDKFFCDALAHYGCIPNDNDSVIVGHQFLPGGKKDHAYAEVEVICAE